tara:strand:+ start:374 stop:484 length:111 start_codon:yes stop_codon:yes gene_type:complete
VVKVFQVEAVILLQVDLVVVQQLLVIQEETQLEEQD